MRSIYLCLFISTLSILSYSQQTSIDKIFLNNGNSIVVKVIRVSENTVLYKFPNEDAEQTVRSPIFRPNKIRGITLMKAPPFSDRAIVEFSGSFDTFSLLHSVSFRQENYGV